TLVAKYEADASSSRQELVFSARIASIINTWYGEEPKKLLQELEQYRRKQPLFEDSQVSQFDNIMEFWSFVATKVKELGKSEKVFQISCIRASLLYEERITQIKKEMFLGQNAALPIYNDNQESILLNDEEDEITDLLDEDSFQNEDD
ncbi:43299_t:CDS:2, partial [Gigaspora margarita]